jgi:acyl-[acyl-carrier-protein]-phospholipid O-acyltransferase/long-chain-fatty-acid--[acyl-carrier-protein] ligase
MTMTTEPTNNADLIPVRRFLRQCKRDWSRTKVADSSGLELSGGRLLIGSLAMRQALARHVLAKDEPHVGILLPPTVGGVLANTSVSLLGRVAVNLNYTLSNADLNACTRQAGIRHILTSRRVMEKFSFQLDAELVYLEDLKARITKLDKLRAFLAAKLPTGLLERRLGLTKIQPDDLMTIIFTSGSTGEPKGVMLSHRNVGSNTLAVDQTVHLREEDVLLGVLPFFHSFGYTATMWLPLTLSPRSVYHFNPLDGREVGRLAEQHAVTILMAAPTFLRTYLKRCAPEQLHALNLVIAGAEKLPRDLYDGFREKFGVELSEGYGTTELSPVVSVNVPADRLGPGSPLGTKLGSVGRTLPGVSAKVIDPETGELLGQNREGLLLISGPNVMCGYYRQQKKTAEVLKDGWYNTGDFARIDEEGFIHITGRQSRFSKIGGEMVPHVKIEELLSGILSQDEEETEDGQPAIRVAVTSVADPKKGERIIVVHKKLSMPVEEVRAKLAASGLPNLWIPDAKSFLEVEQIPILGTGKLDLKALKQLAESRYLAKTKIARSA